MFRYPSLFAGALLCLATLFAGCSSVYYGTLEKVGVHKRDIMASRLDDAQSSQTEAKEQFTDALEAFRSTLELSGGDLEAVYDRLNDEYQRCAKRAKDVSERIDDVESVAKDLFVEWAKELDLYESEKLRRASAEQLERTEIEYESLMLKMRDVERSMQPVLSTFRDNVLFLKHNLNAQSISSIQGEIDDIERDVAALVERMNEAIAEAAAFQSRL